MKILLWAICSVGVVASPIEWKATDGGNGHFYELVGSYTNTTNRWTWADSKRMAEERGGHLVTIQSPEEHDFIIRSFFERTKHPFWIGLSDSKTEGKWEWVTGERLIYTNWFGGIQPEPRGDCGIIGSALDSQPLWSGGDADWEAPFVVEWEFPIHCYRSNGQTVIRWIADEGTFYFVEASTDLARWERVARVSALRKNVTHVPVTDATIKFFRVVKE